MNVKAAVLDKTPVKSYNHNNTYIGSPQIIYLKGAVWSK